MTEAHGAKRTGPEEVKALLRKAEQGDTTVLPHSGPRWTGPPSFWEDGGTWPKRARSPDPDQRLARIW